MNRLIVLIFVAIVALPLAANIAGFDGADPGAENRELASFPALQPSLDSVVKFVPGFTAWFEDHFGLRARLIRWYGETRLFAVRVSPTPSVVKGRDGWFFYGEDGSMDDYARTDPLTPEAQANWREAVERARDWLHRRNIPYVFFIAPDKYAIYPEMMPDTIRVLHRTSRTDQVYDALAHSEIAIDLRPALTAAREQERIYQKTDTHWNDRGALLAYQLIIDAVRRKAPATPPAWTRGDFQDVIREVNGMDLAGMMGLTRVIRETDLALVPKRPRLARVVEPPGEELMAQEGRLVTEIPGSSLPRAVIFRDSFVSRLVPFLSEHFSRAVYLWQNDFDADAVTREHADVVIQEIVGRHLYTFVPSPELVPK